MKVSSIIKLVTLTKYVKHFRTLGNFKHCPDSNLKLNIPEASTDREVPTLQALCILPVV